MPRRPTLQDVADRAGVSRAAASFALSGRPGVSETTRQRILDAARELDYVVNIGARNLRRRQAGAIGLHLPDHATGLAYYMDVAFGVVDGAQARGRSVVLLARTPDAAEQVHVDGIVVVDVKDGDELAARILGGRIPVVAGEPVAAAMRQPAGIVHSGYAEATRQLLDHFAERGARRITLVAPPMETAWGRDVRAAHADWCAMEGIEPRVAEVAFAPDPDALGEAARRELISRPDTEAILVVPDGAVHGVIAAARILGRELGKDLLLATCVDGVANRLFSTPVTGIDLRARAFGRECVELLEEILAARAARGPADASGPADADSAAAEGSTAVGARAGDAAPEGDVPAVDASGSSRETAEPAVPKPQVDPRRIRRLEVELRPRESTAGPLRPPRPEALARVEALRAQADDDAELGAPPVAPGGAGA